MKNTFITILLLSLSNIVFSQATYQVSFNEKLGRAPNYQAITKDGSIISAISQDSLKRIRAMFAKVKTNGKLDWAKIYGIDNKTVITNSIIFTKDNGFVACLSSADSISQEIILFKADSFGNIIWQKKLRTLTVETGEQISGMLAASKDGGFYFLQQNSRFYADYKGPHCSLYKFDSEGKLVWNSQFMVTAESDYGAYVTDITETTDMGIVMAVEAEECDGFCKALYFQKFKSDGKPDWIYNLHESVYSYGSAVQTLTGDNNNNIAFILEGGLDVSRVNIYTFSVLNTNTGKAKTYTIPRNILNLQYFFRKNSIDYFKEKSLKSFPGYNSQGYTFTNIYGFDDNWNALNASYVERSSEKVNIFLEKYNMFGMICPDYKSPAIDSFTTGSLNLTKSSFKLAITEKIVIEKTNELKAVPAYGLAELCTGNNLANTNALFTKTVESATAKQLPFAIKITPNPARSYLSVQGLSINQTSSISVIDLSGRLLQTVTQKTATCQLNVSALSKGTYVLKIQDQNRIVIQKFIKE